MSLKQLYAAFDLPDEIKGPMGTYLKRLDRRGQYPFLKLREPPTLHISLGKWPVPAEDVDLALERIRCVANEIAPFMLRVRRVRFLDDHYLWVEYEPNQPFLDLRATLDDALQHVVVPSQKEYVQSPLHTTLAIPRGRMHTPAQTVPLPRARFIGAKFRFDGFSIQVTPSHRRAAEAMRHFVLAG